MRVKNERLGMEMEKKMGARARVPKPEKMKIEKFFDGWLFEL